jgi:hypothetical protein
MCSDFADYERYPIARDPARTIPVKRVAVFLLALCAGCASTGEPTLLEDSLWGDVRALFSSSDSSTKSTQQGSMIGSYTNSPDASGKPAAAPNG